MTQSGYLLLGLTAIVGALVAILVFAVLRFGAAARKASRGARDGAARATASERLSGEIIVSMASGLLVVGRRGEVRILNPAGLQMLGLEAIEDGVRFQTLLGPGAPALVAAIEECRASQQPIVRRAVDVQPAVGAAGATHLGVTVSPIVDEKGELQGAICLFSDLTAVVDLEEQLRLKDSLARLGELTAGLAHEFRNGLATIHGYGRLLVPERLPEEYRPYVAALRAETDSLGEIVTNFLNFAKPSTLSLAAVSLERIAERAADEIRREVTERNGEVTLIGEYAEIQGDEVLLRQAFSNLCRNAVEACAHAGTPPRIVLHGEVDASNRVASLTVTDNGPGIEPTVRDRIFRPFVTTKAEGTGLGLALVQKIIVTHNGRVAAESSEAGTKIRVTLPIATGEPLS